VKLRSRAFTARKTATTQTGPQALFAHQHLDLGKTALVAFGKDVVPEPRRHTEHERLPVVGHVERSVAQRKCLIARDGEGSSLPFDWFLCERLGS
jgi:hypothetical protein